jgi:outer membrane receptor protein involved in Fe transport
MEYEPNYPTNTVTPMPAYLPKLLFFFLCSFASMAYGQSHPDAIQVQGSVVDKLKKGIPFCNIGAFSTKDSAYVSGATADDNGGFTLELAPGDYFLRITMMGYETGIVTVKKSDKKNIRLGDILLQEEAHNLDEVVIRTERDQMELKLDKRIYNVSANLNNSGANAAEVLENIPSVTVDAEGNVSLRGNQNVRILVDGKYSGLINGPDALQQLQANMIEKVEVVTNASARYDAQGEVGIINIVLKKNKQGGWNGSVTGNIGYNLQYGGGININYRKGKMNLYGNYAISRREQPGISNTYQRYTGKDTSFVYEQDYEHNRKRLSNNGMIGIDYAFNDYNSLSASFNIYSGLGDNFYRRGYKDMTLADAEIGSSLRLEDQQELEDFYEASVSYKKKFAQKGKEWTADFKWANDQDIEQSGYTETSTYAYGTSLENSRVATQEKTLLLQTDFIQPVFKEGKIEAGYRTQLRHIGNQFSFSEKQGEEWIAPPQYNDHYKYHENIHALYVMAGNTFGRFSVQAGLRGELSDVTTTQLSVGKENNKTYFNLFPSAAFSYKITEGNTLQLSYSRRVNRPGQWDLLPYTKFGDNREIRVGNPELNPEFTHSLEAGWMQQWDKGSLLSSIYYRNTSNVIQRLTTVDPNGLVRLFPMNLAQENSYGFEFNFNYTLMGWLKFNTGLNLFRALTNGTFQGKDLSSDAFSWTNRSTLNATVAKAFRVQASFNYTAPRVNTQGKQLSNYFMDLGISKEFLKGNATVVFNVRDIFNTRRWRSVTDTEEIYAVSNTQWRPRSYQLSFTYRINQKADAAKRIFEDRGE